MRHKMRQPARYRRATAGSFSFKAIARGTRCIRPAGASVLPEDFCKQLGLKGEVALVGGRGRFEIWNLQKWKRAHEEETPTYQHVANVIGL